MLDKLDKLGTIRLTGQAAVHFANSLFSPTKEEIERHNRIVDQIDRDVKLSRDEGGFTAEIAGLDLSFLENEPSSMNIELNLVMRFTQDTVFEPFIGTDESMQSIPVSVKVRQNETAGGGFLSWAA